MGDKKNTKKLRVKSETLGKVSGGANTASNVGDSQNCHNVYESNGCKIVSEHDCMKLEPDPNRPPKPSFDATA